jgi:hypothetical protein
MNHDTLHGGFHESTIPRTLDVLQLSTFAIFNDHIWRQVAWLL